MPKNNVVDKEKIQAEILAFVSQRGTTSQQSLCQLFKISQPTLSRIIKSIKNELLVMGKARETKYAAQRKIAGLEIPIPIYEVLEDASSRQFGILHAIKPNGFYFEAKLPEGKSSIYNDLPYFLNDLRPTGFLGRFIPMQNEDLHLPKDIYMWTADHCLKYLAQCGWNTSGDFILGDKSFQLYLEKCQSMANGIENADREKEYLRYANDVLSAGDPGSSAGGEQPKFTAILLPENKHVLVKFSPTINSEIGERIADILICEHLALEVLKRNACDTAESEILSYNDRIFLEVKRFDRIGKFGRRGLISLGTLDAEFNGEMTTWSKTAVELANNKIIATRFLEKIRFREFFGNLIANNDMHLYNLSFFTQGQIVTDLAPVYDMSPMLFMPRNNQIVKKEFTPPLPAPEHANIWIAAHTAASEFWDEVLKDKRISTPFKDLASQCKDKVLALKELTKLLPR